MARLFTVIGWMVKLSVGFLGAARTPLAQANMFTFAMVWIIGAIGLHVLANALTDEDKAVPPRPVLIGLAIAAGLAMLTGTVVYAQPLSACDICLANGNSWWWCFSVYGYYCL